MSIVAKRSPISATAELCAKWIHTAFFDNATYRYNQLAGGVGYIAEGQSFPYATSHRTALFRRLGFR